MKTGLLFGTFDGLHEGHRHMLIEAKTKVDRLIVSLATDEITASMKGGSPMNSWDDRAKTLSESGLIDEVVKGDEAIGAYSSITSLKPDVVLVGYDQILLTKDLRRFLATSMIRIPIVILQPFQPNIYKSSLLNAV